jgi:mono/diheme cytochrome c family protein
MKLRGKLHVPVLVATLGLPLWGFDFNQVSTIASAENEVGLDTQAPQRGKTMFNGKGVCFGCHGSNGDISSVNNPNVARLNPRPTDLRKPTDKSVRQLYLIIKYGIPGTSMVPMQETTRLRVEDVSDLISYLLALQGKPLAVGDIFHQVFLPDTETDLAISVKCDAEAIGDSDAMAFCEDRYAKRYRTLIVGRPADIPPARYVNVETSCKQRFGGTDLDGLARCYQLEFSLTRQRATESGKEGQLPQKPTDP